MRRFLCRKDAGEALADEVAGLRLPHPVVIALPRGGAPVAAPVAERLETSLDLLMVRKIGVPGQPELAAGAVVNGTVAQTVWNEDVLRGLGLERADLAIEVDVQLSMIDERRRIYLQGRLPVDVKGRDAILIDDGIATGATAKAALKALKLRMPASVTLAVPLAPLGTAAEFKGLVDRFLCLEAPEPFIAVGQGYRDFRPTGDDEVITCLREASERMEQGDGNDSSGLSVR